MRDNPPPDERELMLKIMDRSGSALRDTTREALGQQSLSQPSTVSQAGQSVTLATTTAATRKRQVTVGIGPETPKFELLRVANQLRMVSAQRLGWTRGEYGPSQLVWSARLVEPDVVAA